VLGHEVRAVCIGHLPRVVEAAIKAIRELAADLALAP